MLTRILILSNDAIGAKMAGPAIRSWELANELSREHEVTLVVAAASHRPTKKFAVVGAAGRKLGPLMVTHDVVIFQGPRLVPMLRALYFNKPLVIDLYDPYPIAHLEESRVLPETKRDWPRSAALDIARLQLLAGDFFICAGERQRDFWIGSLAGVGRLRPALYAVDPGLRGLIDVVPFGIPREPPAATHRVLKGIRPGIGEADTVLLWGGGIWNWLDPATPIKAFAKLSHRPDIKLFFMGLARPNSGGVNYHTAEAAVSLSQELGLYERTVFFNRDWVSYDDRVNYLLESDVGLSAHGDHLEAHFAFRTRLLDCIWAGLPIICTEGDELGGLVKQEGLGVVVPCGDPDSMAAGILRLVDDLALRKSCRQNLERLAPRLSWRQVAQPLAEFCAAPKVAVDKNRARRAKLISQGAQLLTRMLLGDLRSEGAAQTGRRVLRFLAPSHVR